MRRRMFTHFVSVIAVVAALGLTQRCTAKPPDLPVNTEHSVTPEFLPDSEWDGVTPLPDEFPTRKISLAEAIARVLQQEWTGRSLLSASGTPTVLTASTEPFLDQLLEPLWPQFAASFLFGDHPLLTIVPANGRVRMCSECRDCWSDDFYGCATWVGQTVVFPGFYDPESEFQGPGVKVEIIPMPKETHGTIEIGIGFSLNGAPTYKCEVTEFWGCGNVRKNNTLQGCWDTLLRCLMGDAVDIVKPAANGRQAMQCPWSQKQPECEHHALLPPSIRQNLENLAQAEELREKGRRLAEDGFNAAAKMCFDDARRLCPGCPSNQRGDGDFLEAEESPEIFLSGVSVMVDGLLKGCYLSLAVGRYGHAVDLARQAYALDPERVAADPVVCNLHLLAKEPVRRASGFEEMKCERGCCDEFPDCPDCPCCPKLKSQKSNPLIDFIASTFAGPAHLAPLADSGNGKPYERVQKGYDGEEQEPHVFQKAIAKPYRETNVAPASIGKGD